MASVLASSAVDRGSGQTKDYKLICVASPLRSKSNDWLAENNESE